jgi:hypothetical protein
MSDSSQLSGSSGLGCSSGMPGSGTGYWLPVPPGRRAVRRAAPPGGDCLAVRPHGNGSPVRRRDRVRRPCAGTHQPTAGSPVAARSDATVLPPLVVAPSASNLHHYPPGTRSTRYRSSSTRTPHMSGVPTTVRRSARPSLPTALATRPRGHVASGGDSGNFPTRRAAVIRKFLGTF